MIFEPKNVLVAGDLMLDIYTIGEVARISPEAPVPVLRVTSEEHLPGGAGNALLNLVSLGMNVVALGRVGTDEGGEHLLSVLESEKVDTTHIIRDEGYQTPLKNRMIASGQQLVRIDYEEPSPHTTPFNPQTLNDIDVVAISDYAKGFLTPAYLEALISEAQLRKIPIVVDPKGRDFTRYAGVTLLKPNLSEAITAAGLGHEATLDEIAAELLSSVETLMITRSSDGISLFEQGTRHDFPAHVQEVKDVTGAGDTVLAIITAALANNMPLTEAAELANIAAGIAIERLGCARISQADLIQAVEC